MKSILSISFLVLVLQIFVTHGHAAEYTIPGTNITLEYEISENPLVITITDCNEDAKGDLTIPDTIEGIQVTTLGESAFASCEDISSVVIGGGIVAIGDNAFSYCDSLFSITVDENNTYYKDIEGILFKLDSEGNAYELVLYPIGRSDSNYTIPDGVEVITEGAFSGATTLTSVLIPESVTVIEEGAFRLCSSLTDVEIPNSVTTIGTIAFLGCYSLKYVKIGSGVSYIGGGAFSSTSLQNYDVSDENPYFTDINGVLFALDTEGNATDLWHYPAARNDTSYFIPHGTNRIGDGAFRACFSILHIIVPGSVTTVGRDPFSACRSLTSITFMGDEPDIESFLFFRIDDNLTLYFYEDALGFSFPTWEGHQTDKIYPVLDPDYDGYSNSLERALGTNPFSQQDRFQVWLSRNSDKVELFYEPHSEKCDFDLEWTDTLTEPESWEPYTEPSFTGEGRERHIDLGQPSQSPVFYRMKVTEL